MDHKRRSQPSSSSSCKLERKIIEKNRRTEIKNLFSELNSLLPNPKAKEAIAVRDQIDEAINYIESLETKVKMAQEKKERLMERKKRSASEAQGSVKPPKMEIHETGSSLEVILTCGCRVDNESIFCEIIQILHEENVDVITINSSMVGDSMLHVVHGEVGQPMFQYGVSKVSERLKRFVNGGSMSYMEIDPEFCDFEFGITETDTWGLLAPTVSKGFPPNLL